MQSFVRPFALMMLIVIAIAGTAIAAGPPKVIFDTDLAGDIDDAFAHALIQVLAAEGEIELLGITCGDGPTEERAVVSCRMLYECGMEDVPVAFGRRTRLEDSNPPQLIWGEGFTAMRPMKMSAADFIIEQLERYPGEVIIISVGPVTNLGDVIRKDPAAWKKVKKVYSMFGSFYMGYDQGPIPHSEWNVRADVESAQLFMTSGVPIVLAGLDVTTMVKFDRDRREAISMRQSPLTDALCGLYSLWARGNMDATPTLFDPVAIVMLLTDEYVSTRDAHVRVTDEGYTVLDESKSANCTIGMHINTKRFLDWLTPKLLNQNFGRW
jgi:purine nucleosidase